MNEVSRPSKFKVVILEEGLGNLGSKFYYTSSCIESAPPLFEGKKCYIDHPDALEEKIQPERSVEAIVGHYEGVHVEKGDEGQSLLVADLVVLPGSKYDWVRAMLETAVGFKDRFHADFIGISINASGPAEEISLESLLNRETIPTSAMPKIEKAIAEGISDVQLCRELKEAISADLVTEAGAKGRVLQMLEQEKKRMSVKQKKESEKKEKKHEGDAPPAPAAKDAKDPKDKKAAPADKSDDDSDGDQDESENKEAEEDEDGADGAHDDEEQDKELIAQMLKKYLGDEEEHPAEVHEAMHQAYQMAKEMGLEGEEAEKAAGYSMKMAKMSAEKKESEEAKKAEEVDVGDQPGKGANALPSISKDGPAQGPKESAHAKKLESQVLTLTGENSALKAKLKKIELKEFLDKTLRESKLPREATDKFRSVVGEVKSEKEITEKFSIFKEATTLRGESSWLDAYVTPEKTQSQAAGFSLADCVKY